MGLESKLGQMEQSMKETGKMIRLKDKEDLSTQTKTFMKDSSLPEKLTGAVNILRREAKYTKELLITTSPTAAVSSP